MAFLTGMEKSYFWVPATKTIVPWFIMKPGPFLDFVQTHFLKEEDRYFCPNMQQELVDPGDPWCEKDPNKKFNRFQIQQHLPDEFKLIEGAIANPKHPLHNDLIALIWRYQKKCPHL